VAESTTRTYAVNARSTDTLGRVQCNARNHHFIIDGPVQAGFPGEAITPAEVFLAGIAACGVELVQALARDQKLPLSNVKVDIDGMMDRSKPVRQDVTVFNAVALNFQLAGVTQAQADDLIHRFRGR
jgi:uncharacterized OsmC-like protein